jgi:hypothetical protein
MNIAKRFLSMSAIVAMAAVLAGCGGGGSSSNIDEGTTFDPINGKTIFRSLENESDMEVFVDMYINDRERVGDGVIIRPRSFINVEISGLDLDDYIKYYAEFENGDRTEGTFSEDGATIFRNNRSRAGVTTEQVNGKQAVKPGAPTVKYRAKKAK